MSLLKAWNESITLGPWDKVFNVPSWTDALAQAGQDPDNIVISTANKIQGREYAFVFVWHPLAGRRDATACAGSGGGGHQALFPRCRMTKREFTYKLTAARRSKRTSLPAAVAREEGGRYCLTIRSALETRRQTGRRAL